MNGRGFATDGRAEPSLLDWPPYWPLDLDLHEEDGELVVHADADGLAEDDFDVALDGDILFVRGNCLAAGDGVPGGWRAARLRLPFVPLGMRRVRRVRRGHQGLHPRRGLEVRLRIPEDDLKAAADGAGAARPGRTPW